MKSRVLSLLLAIFVSGCNAQVTNRNTEGRDSCDEVLKPSKLLTLSKECDGRRVVVRGFIRDGFEKHGIWDSQEDIENANFVKACVTLANPRNKEIQGPVRLVDLAGVFRAKRPQGLIILGSCGEPILEVERVDSINSKRHH